MGFGSISPSNAQSLAADAQSLGSLKLEAGKARVAAAQEEAVTTGVPLPVAPRPLGPAHGAVTNMKIDLLTNEVAELKAGNPMVRLDAAASSLLQR